MERDARELEVAVRTDCGSHAESLAVRSDAALYVTEVLFQSTDGDGELVSEIIKEPFGRA